jgi:hypothetical protein
MLKITTCFVLCGGALVASQLPVSIEGEWLFIKRYDKLNESLVLQGDATVYDTQKLINKMGYESGYRIAGGIHPNPKSSYELVYMSIAEWRASKTLTGNGNLSFPFENSSYTHDYTSADRAKNTYRSGLWGAEFNYWRHMTPRDVNYFSGSGIAGVRYLSLDEAFKTAFTRGLSTSDYKIGVKNQLPGPQVGFNVQWNPTRWLSWDLMGKVGVLWDLANDKVSLKDYNNTVTLRQFDRSSSDATLLIDLSARVAIECARFLDLHVGYDWLYLNHLALALNQIDKNTDGRNKPISVAQDVMFYGLFAGLQLRF